ncbi:accessory gene regulator B family protein [Clostridium gasigenes]|uniref:accessory gene regulator B family protein n=1 Tax=Clostridium gasigenes TaxID=94869 RepID=UPI001C0C4BCF|nr:accessory gene regulator B family protein [Clostridium gasigenes]
MSESVFLAPLEHRNNPLNKQEKNKYKRIVIYFTSIILLFSIVGFSFSITYEYAIYTSSAIICILIMIILEIGKKIIKLRGGIKT